MSDIDVNGDRIIGRSLLWCGEIMSLIWGHDKFEIKKKTRPSRDIKLAVG